MKKTISIIMAFVIALSVCAVMTFASDSAESIIKDCFVLATTSEKTTAATFAIGETVYGKVSGDGAQCYKLEISEKTNIDFEFTANSKIDVTIEKSDGSDKTVLTGDKLYEKTVSLDEANYYITVKNFVPAVEEEPSTEETTEEEETSKHIENDIGELSPQSADEPTETEFKFVACVDELPTAYVKINHNTAELTSGETLQLKLYDCTIENLNHFWRVYDDPETDIDETNVATVAADGLVRINMGNKDFSKETTIKVQAVMYYDGIEATKSCTIKATPSNVYLEPYFGDKEDNCLKLGVGAYRLITATTNVEGGKIVWSSSDESVATVSASGKITAVSVGQATVTATLEGTTTKRNILVKVDTDYTSVMGVKLDKNTAEVRANEGFALSYTFKTMPEDDATPSNSKVIFTSSDPAVATVDENGNVKGVAEGTATITITTEDGSYTDECKVTVTKAIPNWLMVIIAPFRMLYNFILLIIDKVK